jgi:hypothetical protein
MAAAAILVAALGVGLYMGTRPAAPTSVGNYLGITTVGHSVDILANARTRGGARFVTGDTLMLATELNADCYVMLARITEDGTLRFLPPVSSNSQLTASIKQGQAKLGPWRLDGVPGNEVLLLIAMDQKPDNPRTYEHKLQQQMRRPLDLDILLAEIQSWPAEVQTLHLIHVARTR